MVSANQQYIVGLKQEKKSKIIEPMVIIVDLLLKTIKIKSFCILGYHQHHKKQI